MRHFLSFMIDAFLGLVGFATEDIASCFLIVILLLVIGIVILALTLGVSHDSNLYCLENRPATCITPGPTSTSDSR